jgi:hypothetical protein
LEDWFWYTWSPAHAHGWVLAVARAASWVTLLLILVHLVFALWSPSRSLQDRLAGTYLVPR